MLRCEHCRVELKGNHTACPLCGGIILGDGNKEEETFPLIPTIYQEFSLMIRIMILVSISVVAVCFAINILFTRESRWSIFVGAGFLCMWLSLFFVIRKKNNIPKTIVWQVVLLSVLAVLWDYFTNWHSWSIEYVIPIIYVIVMIVMPIASKILKIGVQDLIIYMFINILFGFLPAAFVLFGWLKVILPSVICVACSVISLSALILFEGDNMRAELKKRMHI